MGKTLSQASKQTTAHLLKKILQITMVCRANSSWLNFFIKNNQIAPTIAHIFQLPEMNDEIFLSHQLYTHLWTNM